MTSHSTSVLVQAAGISKRFGATQALAEVDLDVRQGTVHALVGANGAGKSTCLSIIAGRTTPSAGSVEVDGVSLHFGDPRASRRAGIAMIYQELTIVPAFTTQANAFLNHPEARAGWLREDEMRTRFRRQCEKLGVSLPVDVRADSLSVADQQLLEIVRALMGEPRIILFDEPTASLAPREREALFRVMRDLREQGVAIVFVSHNLDEVLAIADEVTVFRNGRVVAHQPAASWTKPALVEAMLGRSLEEHLTATEAEVGTGAAESSHHTRSHGVDPGEVLVRTEHLSVPGTLEPMSFAIRRGEILGLGGLVGSGRTTVLRALAGVEPHASGQLWMNGQSVRWPTNARAARSMRIALISEDRQHEGLLPRMTWMDNVVVSDFAGVARIGFLPGRRVRAGAVAAMTGLTFDLSRASTAAGGLSGGNQQKLLLARWRHCPPALLLADEPTRGIDVGAKEEVLRALREMAATGTSIVIVSSELEDLIAVCDRILVLAEGHLVGELDRDKASVESILHMAFRAQEAAA